MRLVILVRLTRAADGICQTDFNLFSTIDDTSGNPFGGATVSAGDDHVLADVCELACEVSAVCGFESRIGETLTGTVGGAEVFENGQAFAEVGFDGRFDNFTRRLSHEASHTGELLDLTDAASGTRLGHEVNRVHIGPAITHVLAEPFHHGFGDGFTCVSPCSSTLL
jgi:hypothetical protein